MHAARHAAASRRKHGGMPGDCMGARLPQAVPRLVGLARGDPLGDAGAHDRVNLLRGARGVDDEEAAW